MATTTTNGATPNPRPDAFIEMFLENLALKRAVDEANGRYRAHRKRMETAGVDLKGLALTERFRKLEPDAAAAQLAAFRRYAAWLEMPVGTQPELFAEPVAGDAPAPAASAQLRAAAADEAGFKAGKAGDDRDSRPEELEGEEAEAWDAGWLRGQAVIANRIAAGGEPEAAPRKRGRGRTAAATAGTAIGV